MRTKVQERGRRTPEAVAVPTPQRREEAARGRGPHWTQIRIRLPSLYLPVDPIAPSVTEAMNSLRMQMQAGVPLGKSLRTCGKLCKPIRARHAFEKAAEQIDNGASFDDALHTLSPALSFPEQAILSAGWHAGKIEPAIRSVVTRRDVMLKTRREVRSKMVLPTITFVMASFVAPFPAYFLGSISQEQYLRRALTPIVIAILIYAAVRLFQYMSTRQYAGRGLAAPPPPAMPWDYPMLKIPILALVQKWRNRSEFASIMSDLLGAGVNTLNALQVCAKALPNGVYRNSVLRAQRRIEKEGISIAEALPPGDLWPMDWIASLEVGHNSGEEETVFRRLGDYGREQYLSAVRAAGVAVGWGVYAAVSIFIIVQIFALLSVLTGGLRELGL